MQNAETAIQLKPRTVLSMEQALSMSYATLRLAHLGWRVIRIEPTPIPGRATKGDPNRSIGRVFAGEDRHSYYVAPNCGKEAIAIDLKQPEGRALLQRLIRELPVDVFCTNTLPAHHPGLGVDYDSLRAIHNDLIWCCISAMGTEHPHVPGYDPVMQALCGFMDLTGAADGPPTQCGPPITDLKAGDEAFTQVMMAFLARAEGRAGGAKIDISMAHCAVSWLHTFLPLLDMGSVPSELKRSGNEHRQFIPVNAYPTSDGFIYLAIGGDAQWLRITKEPLFAALDQPRFATNEGRRRDKDELHRLIGEITKQLPAAEISRVLTKTLIPHSPITPVENVMDLPFVASTAMRTIAPDGRVVRLPPPAQDTKWIQDRDRVIPFAPAYGEHTDALLAEIGLREDEVASLHERGIVA